MARATSPGPIPVAVMRIAITAYDAGNRLVCSWLNEGLANWCPGLRIECEPPRPDTTLEECRRALTNVLPAYRAMTPELPPDDKLQPWLICYFMDGHDHRVYQGITLAGDRGDGVDWSDERYWRWEIDRMFGVQHAYGWRETEFRTRVVETVEFNTKDWMRWFRSGKGPAHGKAPVAETDHVQLFGPDETPWVNGKQKDHLTAAEYDIVYALIMAFPGGLNKDGLENVRGGARRTLKSLMKNDPDWRKVLQMAEKTCGRYRIK